MLQIGNKDIQYIIDVRKLDPRKLLQEISKKTIIGHNIKFDYQVIKNNFGIELENLFDTMLAAQILECGLDEEKGHFTLERTATRYTGINRYCNQGDLFAPTITKKIRESFAHVEDKPFTQEQIYYGALDVAVAYLLYEKEMALLKENELMSTAELEFQFVKVLGDMELAGIYLNQKQWLENYRVTLKNTEELKAQLLKYKELNWDSHKQVLPVMKQLGVDVSIIDKKTGEIKESVSRQVVKKQSFKDDILKIYLDYKLSQKASSTYGEKFLRHVNPTSQRIHSSYMQIMRTGRTSSTNPNCQNISRGSVYRSAFQAEDNNVFVGADFSNIEARILADKSGDENFINIFINNGDYHLETAKLAFDNPNLTKQSEERQLAKTINFAIAFGAGAKKVSEGAGVTLAKGKELLNKVYTAFPKLLPYFVEQGNLTRQRGYVVTNMVSKRRSYIPFYKEYLEAKAHVDYFKSRGWDPHPKIVSAYKTWDSKIQRWSQNLPVQATAADIAKETCVQLREKTKKIPFKIILFVHDEVVVECLKEKGPAIAKLIEKIGLECSKKYLDHLTVPAEAHVSTQWEK